MWNIKMFSTLLQSRSRQEDPEQLRLKQKAKEVKYATISGYVADFSVKPVWKTYLCVTAHILDATAGAGSDQAERSQPNSPGSDRTEEKAENGLSC